MATLFALLISISFAVIAAAPEPECFDKCRFRFCNYKSSFEFNTKSDVSFTGAICDKKGAKIGVVDSTGEARIIQNYKATPISKWYPHGLKQKFSLSFFKSFRFYGRSGIGHETPQQNQADFLDDRCFALPVTAYQVIDDYGHVVENVHPFAHLKHTEPQYLDHETHIIRDVYHHHEPHHDPHHDHPHDHHRGDPLVDCIAFYTYTH